MRAEEENSEETVEKEEKKKEEMEPANESSVDYIVRRTKIL